MQINHIPSPASPSQALIILESWSETLKRTPQLYKYLSVILHQIKTNNVRGDLVNIEAAVIVAAKNYIATGSVDQFGKDLVSITLFKIL